MVGDAKTYGYEDIVAAVASLVAARAQSLARSVGCDVAAMGDAVPGKMLRTRLAARIVQGQAWLDRTALVALCAATELLHLASLCHDNATGSTTVLLGDLLLVDSTDMVVATRGGQHVKSFLDKAKEALESDIYEQVNGRGRPSDLPALERLARGKTGPLFAFTAGLGGTGEGPQAQALAEAGYRIGTACRLGEDLAGTAGASLVQKRIAFLCADALASLAPWPAVQGGLASFLVHDMRASAPRRPIRHEAPIEAAR